jgi:putative membrane-bound dehydrogenase-like protein
LLVRRRLPNKPAVVLAVLAGFGLVLASGGADRPVDGRTQPAADAAPLPFKVPAGFVAERVAGTPLVEFPMFACLDDRGRLFVIDSAGVNWLPDQLSKNPPHRLRLLEDTHASGRFDRSTVFADRLTYPQGVLWHDGAVYTASPPSLWRFEESRGQRVAGKRQELLTGFTFTKWADDLHGPFAGPDGRIYWTCGRYPYQVKQPHGKVLLQGDGPCLFRCRPDGSEVEVFSSGIGNPVEVAFTAEGEPLAAGTFAHLDRARDDAIMHAVEGGVYPILDRDVKALRGVKHTGEPLPAFVHFAVVAPSGLMRYRGTAFGTAYQGNLFSALFGARAVKRHILQRNGATFQARTEDFLVARTDDFHPTDVLEDADGSLLVVDTGNWYSLCPSSRVGKTLVKGGIYRIRRKDAPRLDDPRGLRLAWDRLTPAELAGLLDDPRWAVRDRAVARLARQGRHAVAMLHQVVHKSGSVRARRNAVWTLTRIEDPAARAAVRSALTDREDSVRLTAAGSAGLHRDREALKPLEELVKSGTPAVRRQAATALGRLRRPEAVPALVEALRAGGDRFLEHALIYALIQIGDRAALLPGLRDPSPVVRRASLIALDQMKEGHLTRDLVTPLLDTDDPALRQTAVAIVIAHPGWAKEITGLLRQWLASTTLDAGRRQSLRGALLAFAGDVAVQDLVARGLQDCRTPVDVRLLLLETMGRTTLPKLPGPWVRELGRQLHHGDVKVIRQAVATIRALGLREFDAKLLDLVSHRERPADVRVAALAAVAPRLDRTDEAVFDFLVKQLNPDAVPLARLAAAEVLGNLRLDEAQLFRLAGVVAGAGPLEVPHLLAAFESTGSMRVGKRLVTALARSPGLASLTPQSLQRALNHFPAEVRHEARPLFKRLEVDTVRQKMRLAELKSVLSGGDAGRGRLVFFGTKASCSACHTVHGQGGRVGPELSHIGATRSGPDLLEAIVFPSASFARGFEPYVIETRAGKTYTGIITRKTADALVLRTADRAEVRLPRSAVETISRGRVSLMPQGLDGLLSKEELGDLIRYLQSLR